MSREIPGQNELFAKAPESPAELPQPGAAEVRAVGKERAAHERHRQTAIDAAYAPRDSIQDEVTGNVDAARVAELAKHRQLEHIRTARAQLQAIRDKEVS